MDLVPLLNDVIEATRKAKADLDEALVRLSDVESDYNRRIRLPGADAAALNIHRAAAEEALGIEDLIERRQWVQRWAGLIDDCVRICETFRLDRVVAANIRRLLRDVAAADDADLFAMTLLRHVRNPEDPEIYVSVRAILQRVQRSRL